MKRIFGNWLTLSLFLTVCSPGFAETPPTERTEPRPKITLYVYDFAGGSPEELARAGREATRVFLRTGVEMAWHSCLTPSGERAPACRHPLGPTNFVLRIVPSVKEAQAAFNRRTCAATFRSSDGDIDNWITVYRDCVRRAAKPGTFSFGLILGHVAAHEVGHVLLPWGTHNSEGLMRARLGRKDWKLAARGALNFTPEEFQHIRAGVLMRMQQQEPVETATLVSPE
jgi:predicted Zn-dependent protease with MMP-like domain